MAEPSGHERTLLLVHGSPGNGQAWAGVVQKLRGQYHLLMPTLPGHASDAPAHPGSVGRIADLLEAELAAAPGRIAVIGYSFGGVVALDLAARGHPRIDRLMLLEPVAVPALKGAGEGDSYAVAERVFTAYIAAARQETPDAIGSMVDFWFGAGAFAALPERMRGALNAAARRNADDVAATFMASYDAASLARLPPEVEIVLGSASPPTTHAIAAALQRLAPRIRVTPLAGGTHAMLQTHAATLAEKIDAFCG